jgi:DNA ligase-1
MKAFAELVDNLYYLNSNNAKTALVLEYLANTPSPDRGWAIGAIAGTLSFEFFKRRTVKEIIVERVDPALFELSYDYVGEMSETVAHLWSTTLDNGTTLDNDEAIPNSAATNTDGLSLPSLDEVVSQFLRLPKQSIKPYLVSLLNVMTPTQRWALLKLGTRGLRIGVSARFMKKMLAEYGAKHNPNITLEDIERVWHGVEPPYSDLLAWLENKAEMPDISNKLTFQPVMLAHPIDETTLASITNNEWQAEWKFDGIRTQLVSNHTGTALFSRTGDDISASFPDLVSAVEAANIEGRFDGELLALHPSILAQDLAHKDTPQTYAHIASFNQLQQRLNKKKPSKALITSIPVGMIVYDALQIGNEDLREQALSIRSKRITALFTNDENTATTNVNRPINLFPCEQLIFENIQDLRDLKERASKLSNGYIEGIMIKRKNATYVAGRPKGQWFKLKRDPKMIDAVIMYAQRGHGKRSSFYSDFTFGCWQDEVLLPIGKAYSGFTDEELKKLDTWVRRNTLGRFGPVKEVKKELVFEIAFDAVAVSNRHKSKVALRFPRIHRIRWDKPANEADHLDTLIAMIE